VSNPVISVDNIGKMYSIRHQRNERYQTLRDVITEKARNMLRQNRNTGSADRTRENFWALRHIGFEVSQGDVIGIIGRNGAGKSTLLKILSRITEPTEGKVRIKGRVASLLEVGTGFHNELTGRENIFLNGAILGMSRREIRKKFDEIVAFAEVDKFLDTPVKRYSSGMYVRLAFAVAAHLEPEILIIDEVLAVGDAEFQNKCLGKMRDVSSSGRTVLFVSHNMSAVRRLCRSGLYLDKGRIALAGDIERLIETYAAGPSSTYTAEDRGDQPRILEVGVTPKAPRCEDEIRVFVRWSLPADYPGIKIGVGVNSVDGQRIFDFTPADASLETPSMRGVHTAELIIPGGTLMAKTYLVSVGLWQTRAGRSTIYEHIQPAAQIGVHTGSFRPYMHQRTREGLVHVACGWRNSD
jgi:lipopolysaccharide transport system ATP-binding protein